MYHVLKPSTESQLKNHLLAVPTVMLPHDYRVKEWAQMLKAIISVQDVLETRDCKIPGCPNEADGKDGLCSPCRKKGNLLKMPETEYPSGATEQKAETEMKPVTQLKPLCKWEGCNNPVKSHKGTAGYCIAAKIDGKTHRQLHMEKRQEQKAGVIEKPPQLGTDWPQITPLQQLEINKIATLPEDVTDSSKYVMNIEGFVDLDKVDWLNNVKFQLMAAIEEVAIIEKELEAAKERLRKILDQAQKDLA